MLFLCDDSIVLPLMLIFNNILTTGVYPEMWRLGNVTPIHKKVSKQLPILKICMALFFRNEIYMPRNFFIVLIFAPN